MKAAASAWLRAAAHPGDLVQFDFARPDGAEIGSVLDIRFKDRGLRVHLDQAVAPVWDEAGCEPVLGVSVPVDRDTLIDRWYVHRIRLDSVGTSRQVRIGTEAFMRPTEWFALEECEMTGRGLSTPAVDRLVRSRSTRPVSRRATGQARKASAPEARAEVLLRKLTEAQKLGSVIVVTQICGEIAAVTGLDEQGQAQSRDAVAGAQVWLKEQAAVREQLFVSLREAVEALDIEAVRTMSVTANATASHARTSEETAVAAAADALLTADAQERHEEIMAAERDTERARRAAERVRALLSALRRPPVGLRSQQRRVWIRSSVQKLLLAAEQADSALSAREREHVESWRARTGSGGLSVQPGRPAAGGRQVHDVVCPACGAGPGVRCETPRGYHPSRAARLRRSR
ncbi:zinc finger domain-containing protein [Streptomyces erythrochromogenes]|uniref:zinc finger domain-containing protein n=1 Tax=Streptomyces erythrochromogenes TaxID=285574 RepID=UPI00340BEEFC